MKEIISFLVPKDLCEGCTKDCRKMLKDKTLCYLSREPYALVENKVPTNWEELKELCADLEDKDVFITSAGDCIEFHGLQFWVSGAICHETDKYYSIKNEVSFARMWQIIKSLIGEE